jgi:hypothetical protein
VGNAHYAGTTSQGEPISFELAEDAITNVIATIRNSARSEVLAISAVFRADSKGAWSGTVAQSDITLKIDGHLREDGRADGTLHVAFDRSAARLSPVAVSWSARPFRRA